MKKNPKYLTEHPDTKEGAQLSAEMLRSIARSSGYKRKVRVVRYGSGWNVKLDNPIHPQALESLKRYKEDLKAGHKGGAEFWRGSAGAYFTANPIVHMYPNWGYLKVFKSESDFEKVAGALHKSGIDYRGIPHLGKPAIIVPKKSLPRAVQILTRTIPNPEITAKGSYAEVKKAIRILEAKGIPFSYSHIRGHRLHSSHPDFARTLSLGGIKLRNPIRLNSFTFPIVDIGQLAPTMRKELSNLARQGKVIKYTDYTFPTTKTGYAISSFKESPQKQVARETMRSFRKGIWVYHPKRKEIEKRLLAQLKANPLGESSRNPFIDAIATGLGLGVGFTAVKHVYNRMKKKNPLKPFYMLKGEITPIKSVPITIRGEPGIETTYQDEHGNRAVISRPKTLYEKITLRKKNPRRKK